MILIHLNFHRIKEMTSVLILIMRMMKKLVNRQHLTTMLLMLAIPKDKAKSQRMMKPLQSTQQAICRNFNLIQVIKIATIVKVNLKIQMREAPEILNLRAITKTQAAKVEREALLISHRAPRLIQALHQRKQKSFVKINYSLRILITRKLLSNTRQWTT